MTLTKGELSLLDSRTHPLVPGTVTEGFASSGITDQEGLAAVLRILLRDAVRRKVRRAGVSLPDALFRVQMIDLDELPTGSSDRERLIRWRLEKAAVVDTAGTVLRYQVSPREDRGYSILACLIKRDILFQYEEVLEGQGLDVWRVAPASFNVLNLYAPAIVARGIDAFALVWMADSSYSALIVERGTVRFYRYRDIKASAAGEAPDRLMRELDDTLHFYTHMDRGQRAEIGNVFLAGPHPAVNEVAAGLRNAAPFDVEMITPSAVLPGHAGMEEALAPVLGAGGAL